MKEANVKDSRDFVDFYLNLGLSLIPAYYGEKRPSVEWKKFQRKPPSKDQIRKWFDNEEKPNVAILCGKPSGNLVVLDFDDKSVYPKFFETSQLEEETLVVKTGSGKYHVYLRTDKPIPSFRIPQLKLEVRSTGNVVIAPPSKHPSGKFYQFVNLDVTQILEVKDMVNAIWKKAKKLGVEAPQTLFEEELGEQQGEPYEGPDPPCIRQLLEGVEQGCRNEVGLRLASYWLKFKRNAPPAQVLKRLKDWNTLNKPPLPISELRDIIKSARKLDRSYGCRLNQAWCNIEECPLKRKHLARKKAEEEAETILSSADVLKALKPHLDNVLSGEDENKQLTFMLLLSGVINDPALKQIILLKGESGAGKTTQMRLADAFKTKNVGRFSAHALDYSNLEDYEILRLKEIGTMDQEFQGVSTVKFLASDDRGYTVEVTERDERGRFATKQYRVPSITLITSTTRVILDPQFERRSWILNADESGEQTNRIRVWKARHEKEKGLVTLGLLEQTSYDHSIEILKAVVRKLDPYHVVLIFPESLTQFLKSDRLRVRGDYDKIIGLVKLHAFLHQRRLPKAKGVNDQTIVFVTPPSALQALKVALKPFITMTTELEERPRKLIEILKDIELSTVGNIINHETREKIARKLGTSDRTIYRYLKQWCKAGYMSEFKDKSLKGHPVSFRLLYDLNHIIEKKAVSFDISNANTKIGSNMQKEIEEWLNCFSDKIIPRKGWSKEKIRKTLLEQIEAPYREGFLSKEETKTETSSVDQNKQDLVVASPTSKKKRSDSQEETSSNILQKQETGKASKPCLNQHDIVKVSDDLLKRLRQFNNFSLPATFQNMAKQIGGLTDQEALTLFNQLVDKGLLAKTTEGRLSWVKRKSVTLDDVN